MTWSETEESWPLAIGQCRGEQEREWLVSVDTKIVKMQSLHRTDLLFNKRVCLLDGLVSGKETGLQHFKGKIMEVAKEYVEDQEMSTRRRNLTIKEWKGFGSFKDKRGKADIVVYQTDKV